LPASTPLRILFAGTPDFAAQIFRDLIDHHYSICAVFTQPDRPAGRGRKLTPSPVKQLAIEHDLPVHQPLSLRDPQVQQCIAEYQADIMIVVAYGLILPIEVLALPRYGCFNVHGSLLPRWRGAAPIQHSILAGDSTTGVTIMQMDAGLDTGDMLVKRQLSLEGRENSATLHDQLAQLGGCALREALTQLQQQQLHPIKQDEQLANYAHKISKQDALLDWEQPAVVLDRQVRAYHPWPVSYFQHQGQHYRVWQAKPIALEQTYPPGYIVEISDAGLVVATATGGLLIEVLQRPGGKALPIANLRNAGQFALSTGTQLQP